MPKLVIQEDGVSKSERRTLNFIEGTNITLTISDDVVGNQADIQIDAAGGAGAVATDAIWDAKGDLAGGTGPNTAARLAVGADDTILMADAAEVTGLKWVAPATPSTQAFGDTAAPGTADTFTRGDHKHAMPADPVTAHAAAADPHTGYRLETADHSHVTTGLQAGQIDHGTALTGLTDDDHTQYIRHAIADAAGDLLLASGADVFARLAIGADTTVLTSNGATAAWQAPGAAAHPAFTTHTKFGVD